MFFVLLTCIVNASNHKVCFISNEKCTIQPTLINLHPSKYSQEFHYYSFAVRLDRFVGSCNTVNDSSNKVCV